MCNSRRVTSWLWAKTGEGHRALRFPSKCFLLLNSKAANKPPSQLMLDVTYNVSGGCRGSVLFYLTRFCLRSGQAFLARLAPWMWGFGQCQQGAVRLNCLVGSAAFDQRSKPCWSFARRAAGVRQRMGSSAAEGDAEAAAFGARTGCKGQAGQESCWGHH